MDTLSSFGESDDTSRYPSPKNLEEFLPWACFQFQLEVNINIIKSGQGDYVSPFAGDKKAGRKIGKPKEDKLKQSKLSAVSSDAKVSQDSAVLGKRPDDTSINIETVYDSSEHLVQLKFHRNQNIPRSLLNIISLIISFHPHLTTIIIDRGLKCDALYELYRIVSLSKITEVILDNTVLVQANYYVLLFEGGTLKYLSLARCKINDKAVEAIANRLMTSSLCILNLTSNMITDEGATHLGHVLRSNRKLLYLNLADNMITDKGAEIILNCLMEFPLDPEEVAEKKKKRLAYLKNKNELVTQFFNQMRLLDMDKKKSIKKVPPTTPRKSKALSKDISRTFVASLPNVDALLMDKAVAKAKSVLGPFNDPFSGDNTLVRDGTLYCRGNNFLCYLNLAYNNLNYFTVKKLFDVITVQECWGRTPKGLVNVCIDGNNIPESCFELSEIDYILQSALATSQKVSTMFRKRPTKVGLR